ncbi:hypothetical protein HMPREF1624_08534 [Sporothrix schenckii ATCC 58251]|uniref:Myb-like DNA-binding domain-containing protein n=1 Tax=Sporothrix schenckii (strain ATCC 58251 / de Perez 2211183) TaxID=1391915 RepID=U7PKJ4_SPOS1|nr:hypothetical protein HMPREF1624_08534 [Sporothrix schenckii ATCC 58251]
MSTNEQISFLPACIKHTSNGGKIDFAAVATDLNIPTKNAAAKRYERLKKRAQATDFGTCNATIEAKAEGNESDNKSLAATSNTATKPKRRAPVKPRANRKDKADGVACPSNADDTTISNDVYSSPLSVKRKRESANDALSNPSDADYESTCEDSATEYYGSQFVAVNDMPNRDPVAKRAKAQKTTAAIKLESEADVKDIAEAALAEVKSEGHEIDQGI